MELLTTRKGDVELAVVDFADAFIVEEPEDKERGKRFQRYLAHALICKNDEVLGYFAGKED